MKLSREQLNDKGISGIKEVLSLSFEYLLASVVEEYSRISKLITVREFNEKNKLSLTKTLLYPFFVSLSNGHSESLYKLFGKFYSLSFGPISIDIFNLLKEGGEPSLKYFKINSPNNSLGVELLCSQTGNMTLETNLQNCLNSIKEKIKDATITIDGKTEEFKNLTIESDSGSEKPLYRAIESGIDAIKKQSDKFFVSDVDIMKLHASYFEAFKDRYNENDVSVIEYDEIEEGKKRPFYLNLDELMQQ